MNITMFATNNRIQFNLEAESDHEKEFMKMLSSYNGGVEIHTGVSIARCQGGYIRDFGEKSNTTAIVISKPTIKEE